VRPTQTIEIFGNVSTPSVMRFRANSCLLNWNRVTLHGWYIKKDFLGYVCCRPTTAFVLAPILVAVCLYEISGKCSSDRSLFIIYAILVSGSNRDLVKLFHLCEHELNG